MNVITQLKDQLEAIDTKLLSVTCPELITSLEMRRMELALLLEKEEGDAVQARIDDARNILLALKFSGQNL
jgi:hypothetical protein